MSRLIICQRRGRSVLMTIAQHHPIIKDCATSIYHRTKKRSLGRRGYVLMTIAQHHPSLEDCATSIYHRSKRRQGWWQRRSVGMKIAQQHPVVKDCATGIYHRTERIRKRRCVLCHCAEQKDASLWWKSLMNCV